MSAKVNTELNATSAAVQRTHQEELSRLQEENDELQREIMRYYHWLKQVKERYEGLWGIGAERPDIFAEDWSETDY